MKWLKEWREARKVRKIEKLGGLIIEKVAVPVYRSGDFTVNDYHALSKLHETCPSLFRWLRWKMKEMDEKSISLKSDPTNDRMRLVLDTLFLMADEVYNLPKTAVTKIAEMDIKLKQKESKKTLNNLGENERDENGD